MIIYLNWHGNGLVQEISNNIIMHKINTYIELSLLVRVECVSSLYRRPSMMQGCRAGAVHPNTMASDAGRRPIRTNRRSCDIDFRLLGLLLNGGCGALGKGTEWKEWNKTNVTVQRGWRTLTCVVGLQDDRVVPDGEPGAVQVLWNRRWIFTNNNNISNTSNGRILCCVVVCFYEWHK